MLVARPEDTFNQPTTPTATNRQGGLTWLWMDAPYVITARKLFNWAVAENDKGNPFPVGGAAAPGGGRWRSIDRTQLPALISSSLLLPLPACTHHHHLVHPRPPPLPTPPQIHGTCLGHQLLHLLVSNVSRNDMMVETDAVAHASTLEFTAAAADSQTFGTLPVGGRSVGRGSWCALYLLV
jgi:hypothetical protein